MFICPHNCFLFELATQFFFKCHYDSNLYQFTRGSFYPSISKLKNNKIKEMLVLRFNYLTLVM